MKYKLLTEKGTHFVCLDDGTKIPRQQTTVVTQFLREETIATVTAVQDNKLLKDGLILTDGALFLNGKELSGIGDLKYCDPSDGQDYGTVTFSVSVELVDTVEKPKPIAS
jgi:hypothetical protein